MPENIIPQYMWKNLVLILAIMLTVISGMCLSQENVKPPSQATTTTTMEPVPENAVIFKDGTVIPIELARTDAQQMRGLMYREGISENEGMLFIFDKDDYYDFWMKNMNFPIDMVWMDSDFKVVHIEKDAPPCTTRPCPLYGPEKPTRYVLEIKANLSDKRGIEVGDMLDVRF